LWVYPCKKHITEAELAHGKTVSPSTPYITNLKCNYRLRIVRDGYALARSELALFKPEA